MKILLSLAALTGLLCGTVVHAEAVLQAPDQGTVRVTVIDVDGKIVPDAPVYIYGEHRTHFVGGADVPGTTTFSMNEGTYRISSAMVKKASDVIDRYASNEAHVSVMAGDNVSVILTLRPMDTPADQQPVSYAELHVAGIPGSLLSNN
jgi:hypothetical protein